MENDAPRDIRVWIVDDDAELLEILGGSLVQEQREIRLFDNGQAVLNAIEHSFLDILLTDLMMPGVDGLQILKEVKRTCPESIVIIMTGYASLDTAIQAIRGGAYDYIQKPFKLEEMEVVISNACEKISLMRENRRLLQRLKEVREEANQLEEIRSGQLADILGLRRKGPREETDSEMELILRQINPAPPDEDVPREVVQEKALIGLERLIQFRKGGFLSEEEFLSLKKIFFQLIDKMKY